MQKQGTIALPSLCPHSGAPYLHLPSTPTGFANPSLCCTTGKEAGQALERAASIQSSKLNEPDDAANSWTEAFKAYRKSDPEDAIRCLQLAINHYTSKGNFRRAAQWQQNLAECLEQELGDQKRAVEAYEVAGGWYEGDGAEA